MLMKHPAARLDFGYLAGAVLGGGKGGSAPAAPDPAATAQAQAQANKEAVLESAKVNQINQVSPYGNVSYSGTIGSPDRTQTLTLPPEVQAILEGQRNVAGSLTDFAGQFVPQVAGQLGTPFNTANLGVQAPQINDNTYNTVANSLLDRLQPQFERDQNALNTQLANQGIGLGSEAYSNAQSDFGRSRNDARLAALGQAGAEASRQYGLQSQSYNQALSDALLNRTQGLNEVSALLQGAPAIQTPAAPNPAQYQVAPGDYQGAASLQYQGALNNYNQQQQSRNAALGGIAGLGAAALPLVFSDIRVKTDIKRVGATDSGLPVYTFRYKAGGPVQMGVMAQEVMQVRPDAVHDVNGILAVDYGMI